MSLKLCFVIACSSIVYLFCSLAAKANDQCSLPTTVDGQRYLSELKQRIGRNFPIATKNPERTKVRFFVLPDGFVKGVALEEPTNTPVDLACLDSVFSALPFPPPPLFIAPMPPPSLPPSSLKLPPPPDSEGSTDPTRFLGCNWYTISFNDLEIEPAQNLSKKPHKFALLVIPLEVLYRYPGTFTRSELDSPSNTLHADKGKVDISKIELLRCQWSVFYRDHQKASKEEILNWSTEIAKPIALSAVIARQKTASAH